MTDPLWGPVDAAGWRQLPHLSGRLAEEADVRAGRAVFHLDVDAAHAAPGALPLPACGIQTLDDGRQTPVIVIQAEVLRGETLVGVRYLGGGNGVCFAAEVELLDAPDHRFWPA